jgi:glyoxylase-like metal-dependent hydrolase (beta-lactamase superfamily II)
VTGPPIRAITDGTSGRVHAFLLDWGEGLTLIDTLSSATGDVVLAEMARMGRPIGDLKRIVLTHAHRSHVRGAARLRELSSAQVIANAWEGEIIAGERPSAATGFLPRRPFRVYQLQFGLNLGYYVERYLHRRPGFVSFPACEPDRTIGDGDMIGPLQVIHTPGHTDGSMSFYWPAQRALFTGDVVVTWPRLEAGWKGLSTDMDANRRSLSQLVTVGDVQFVGSGHGPPLVGDAAVRLRDLLAGVPTPARAPRPAT